MSDQKIQIQRDYMLLTVVLVLVAIGIVMVYSASSVIAGARFGDSNYYLKRHIMRVCIGLVSMFIVYRINYRHFQKVALPGLFLSIGLLLLMLFAGSESVNGSVRWLSFGSFSFQPSEIAKFALVFYVADSLVRKQDKLGSFFDGYFPLLLIVTGVSLLILMEPDFGSTVIIAAVIFTMFFLGNVRLHHLLATAVAALPFFAVAVYTSPYRFQRLLGFLKPGEDLLGSNYQINQSLISLGSGGFFGVGIGQSKEKSFFLPEPFTDFIYSILGEEMGFIGALFVLVLFLVILWQGLSIARRAPDLYGSLLASGITFTIIVAAFTNIGVVCGLLPTTGLPMPFVSYGGTSLILSLTAFGVLLNISRYQVDEPGKKKKNHENNRKLAQSGVNERALFKL